MTQPELNLSSSISPAGASSPTSYSLATLFLVISVLCVCLGILTVSRLAALIFMLLVVPALFATARMAHLLQLAGRQPDGFARVRLFGEFFTLAFWILAVAALVLIHVTLIGCFLFAVVGAVLGRILLVGLDVPTLFEMASYLGAGLGILLTMLVCRLLVRSTWEDAKRRHLILKRHITRGLESNVSSTL